MKRYEHFTGCLKKVVRWRCVNFIPISFMKCRIHYLQLSTFEQSNSYEPPHEYIETLYLGMQCGIFTMRSAWTCISKVMWITIFPYFPTAIFSA